MSIEKLVQAFSFLIILSSITFLTTGWAYFVKQSPVFVIGVLGIIGVCIIVSFSLKWVSQKDWRMFPFFLLTLVLITTAFSFAWKIERSLSHNLEKQSLAKSSTGNGQELRVEVGLVRTYSNEHMYIEGSILGDTDIGVRLKLPYNSPILPYEECRAFGSVVEPKNGDDFNYKNYLNSKNIFLLMINPKMECTSQKNLKRKLIEMRQTVEEGVRKNMVEPQASLLIGILFGENLSFDPKFDQAIRVSGLSHVVAASGYNVTIVVGLIESAFFFLKSKTKKIISIPFIWIYAFMTGFAMSMVRASLMTTVGIISQSIKLGISPKTVFYLSVALLIIINPLTIFDLGFQLSVCATFGLMFISPSIEYLFKIKWFPYSTFSCIIATLPVTLLNFKTFTPYSLLANMLVLPFIEPVMILGIVGIFFKPVLFLAWGSLKYMEIVCLKINQLPFAKVEISPVLGIVLSVLTILLIFLCILNYEKHSRGNS